MTKAGSLIVDGARTAIVPASAIAASWAEVKANSERDLVALPALAAWQTEHMQKLKSLTIAGFCVESAMRVVMTEPPPSFPWRASGASPNAQETQVYEAEIALAS